MSGASIGRSEHDRADVFTYRAWVDGKETQFAVVFKDLEFDHVEFHGRDLAKGHGTNWYTRGGWRLLAEIDQKIDEIEAKLTEGRMEETPA